MKVRLPDTFEDAALDIVQGLARLAASARKEWPELDTLPAAAFNGAILCCALDRIDELERSGFARRGAPGKQQTSIKPQPDMAPTFVRGEA